MKIQNDTKNYITQFRFDRFTVNINYHI